MPDAIFEAMLQAAIAAPSPDNNQPWLFQVAGDRLMVYLDDSRSLPSDVMSMFDMTSIGAAVENAVIAAAHHGYQADVVWRGDQPAERGPAKQAPSEQASSEQASSEQASSEQASSEQASSAQASAEAGTKRLIAELRVHPVETSEPLFSAIAQRCTCRKLYSTKPLEPHVIDELAAAAASFPEVQVDWLQTSQEKKRFGKLVASTDSLRFQHQPFHEELFRQLRLTPGEVESTRDGLDVRTLELPPGLSSALPLLRSWKTMQMIIAMKLLPLLSAPSAVSVRRSGAIAVVSVPRRAIEPPADPREIFFSGGRAIERIWLVAARLGVSMHPLGSVSIFLLQDEPRAEFKPTIERARTELLRLLPALEGRVVQLTLRVGYSAPPSRRSLRRPAEEVIIE